VLSPYRSVPVLAFFLHLYFLAMHRGICSIPLPLSVSPPLYRAMVSPPYPPQVIFFQRVPLKPRASGQMRAQLPLSFPSYFNTERPTLPASVGSHHTPSFGTEIWLPFFLILGPPEARHQPRQWSVFSENFAVRSPNFPRPKKCPSFH